MVFLSLGELLMQLLILKNEKQKTVKWISTDNGELVILKKEKNKLLLDYNGYIFDCQYDDFVNSTLCAARELLDNSFKKNKKIAYESAFIDFKKCVEKF